MLLAIKRVIRYLRRYPRCTIKIGCDQNLAKLDARTDSDWAVDVAMRRLQLRTATVHHWSKPQAGVALSSGEAELNSAVKGINEAIGLRELSLEVLEPSVHIRIHVDASACKGILLHQGAGQVQH